MFHSLECKGYAEVNWHSLLSKMHIGLAVASESTAIMRQSEDWHLTVACPSDWSFKVLQFHVYTT